MVTIENMPFVIPYSFIKDRTHLDWHDLVFGVRHGALDLKELPKAVSELDESAAAEEFHGVEDAVLRLQGRASSETGDLEKVHRKWLYLGLAWLYAQRQQIPDPLALVESLYADFDYPEAIAPFVRYMPMTEPPRPGETPDQHLYRLWNEFLTSHQDWLS